MYLPLGKVADTPFHIQGDVITEKTPYQGQFVNRAGNHYKPVYN